MKGGSDKGSNWLWRPNRAQGVAMFRKKMALRLKVFTFRAFTRVSFSGCFLMPEISCSFNILVLFKVIFYFLLW